MEETKTAGSVHKNKAKAEPVWSRAEMGLRGNKSEQRRRVTARIAERLLVSALINM